MHAQPGHMWFVTRVTKEAFEVSYDSKEALFYTPLRQSVWDHQCWLQQVCAVRRLAHGTNCFTILLLHLKCVDVPYQVFVCLPLQRKRRMCKSLLDSLIFAATCTGSIQSFCGSKSRLRMLSLLSIAHFQKCCWHCSLVNKCPSRVLEDSSGGIYTTYKHVLW